MPLANNLVSQSPPKSQIRRVVLIQARRTIAVKRNAVSSRGQTGVGRSGKERSAQTMRRSQHHRLHKRHARHCSQWGDIATKIRIVDSADLIPPCRKQLLYRTTASSSYEENPAAHRSIWHKRRATMDPRVMRCGNVPRPSRPHQNNSSWQKRVRARQRPPLCFQASWTKR